MTLPDVGPAIPLANIGVIVGSARSSPTEDDEIVAELEELETEAEPLALEDLFEDIRPIRYKDASIDEIVEMVREQFQSEGRANENVWARATGARLILDYLDPLPGGDWQEKWEFSPLATAQFSDCPELVDPEATTGSARRNQLTGGLSALFGFDVLRPTPDLTLTMRVATLWSSIGRWRKDANADLLQSHSYGTPQTRQHASALLGRVMLVTGKPIANITGEDLLAWRSFLHSKGYAQISGVEHLWSALASLGNGNVEGTFQATRRRGQKSVAELVDRYPVHSRRVRNLLVAYLERRYSSDLDYATIRSLSRILVSYFWCAVEEIEPGIETIDLSEATADAWRQAAQFKTVAGETSRRSNHHHDLMAVRAFYLDLQRWAHDEPEKWAVWACRSPVTEEHLAGYRKYRKRLTSRMHQRTRQRAPVVTRLADAAEQILVETRELFAATAAATPGSVFTAVGQEWKRIDSGVEGRHLRVAPLADPETKLDLVNEEEYAFWALCIVETLRHTGVRIEEMLELTQMDVTPYQHDGGQIILLHVNPSKTDSERIVVVPPELAAIFAQMMKRIRDAAGVTGQALPTVVAYDYHEAKPLEPMPMLFQRTAGRGVKGGTAPMTAKFVRKALRKTCARAGITGNDGEALHFQPHDFRRIFATDALSSGMPPHIIAKLMGHDSLATTQQYMAIFPEEVIRAHRAFVAERRALPERRDEYRPVTDEEWEEFAEHFGKRQIAIGTCMRSYGSSCAHEYACEQCSMARPDEAARPRLERVLASLAEQLDEATERQWRGEIERLAYIRAGVISKIEELDRSARRAQIVALPMPTLRVQG